MIAKNQTGSMFCIKCGKENSGDAAFCQKCGQPFEAEEATRVATRTGVDIVRDASDAPKIFTVMRATRA